MEESKAKSFFWRLLMYASLISLNVGIGSTSLNYAAAAFCFVMFLGFLRAP